MAVYRPEGTPLKVAVGEDIGVGCLSADILSTAVEEGPGNLGRRAAGLDRTVVKLGEIKVAIAIDRGRGGRAADRGLEHPVVVQAAIDAGRGCRRSTASARSLGRPR